MALSVPALSQETTAIATEPHVASKPELRFPNLALIGRVTGKVWLKLLVGVDGIPRKTDIMRRSPEMAFLFDDEARKWGMGCRFTPALDSSGKPVQAWVVFPLSFRLEDFIPPECVHLAEPDYPDEAQAMGMEGWVGLAVLIKSDGNVDNSEVLVVARYPETTSIFDNAAKDAAHHSQYQAAGLGANAVAGWCFIKVPFILPPRSGVQANSQP